MLRKPSFFFIGTSPFSQEFLMETPQNAVSGLAALYTAVYVGRRRGYKHTNGVLITPLLKMLSLLKKLYGDRKNCSRVFNG